MSFSGGCVCGAIRYECTAEQTLATFECHCRDCQHVSGGPFAPVVYVAMSSFKFTKGEPKIFSTESARGGHNKRGFCGDCGTRLSGGESDRGIGINAGSLDDPSLFRPQMQIHVADAQPWDLMDASVPKFEGYPPT